MSDITFTAELEQQEFCDAFLPSAALASWGVWDEEEPSIDDRECTLRDRCGETPVNQRSTAFDKERKCVFKWAEATTATTAVFPTATVTPTPCETPVGPSPSCFGCGQGGCCGQGYSYHLSRFSSLQQYSTEDHQHSSPYQYDNAHEYPPMYDSPYNSSQPNSKSLSPFEHSANYATSIADSTDLDFDYSHLICSHNIEDFGDDIAYGQSENNFPASLQEVSPQVQAAPDFSFIDSIYESVKAELEAEKIVSSPPSDTLDPPSTPPVITLGVDSPVTIVAVDGKEYKVVLQEVKQERKSGTKRKAAAETATITSAPKPKRTPGIPLAHLSIEEINARKREQNRVAAQRYREKKRNCKETEKEEEERLEKRNSFLRVEAVRLQNEIDALRKALLDGAAVR